MSEGQLLKTVFGWRASKNMHGELLKPEDPRLAIIYLPYLVFCGVGLANLFIAYLGSELVGSQL